MSFEAVAESKSNALAAPVSLEGGALPEFTRLAGEPPLPHRPYTGANYPLRNRLGRALWNRVYAAWFRWSPRPAHGWRRLLLRCFGARIGAGSRVYPRARIWAPWNLELGQIVAVADDAEIYNPAPVRIGDCAVISQGAYLC